MTDHPEQVPSFSPTLMQTMIGFFLKNRVIIYTIAVILVGWGVVVAPFDWRLSWLLRDPVPVDAIPDIGENQQIVFTEWSGRSPQDVEDQITYPLSVSLLGVPGVKTIRSFSMFGFSLVYVIFEDDIDFYWARTRVLESLNSLPARELPEGVKPTLGPDATALGQVFWYTLEGVDPEGNVVGGWDLHELRTLQDWYVRYSLLSVPGVSEVASVGGFVQEYQIDVDPDRMRYRNVKLEEVVDAVRRANVDVGARTIEVNKVEYIIRGLGFVKNLRHIEDSFIKLVNDIPILVSHVANVTLGPAARRGALDKDGREAVGGVVVVRFGENPLEVIKKVKEKISEVSIGLPQRTLPDGTVSQIRITPFYDRTDLIHETLNTLRSAISLEMMVTVIVVVIMMARLAGSLLISGLLPIAVLLCFVAMKLFQVDANIVALSGIAIAIGAMVDMGVILVENIIRRLENAGAEENTTTIVLEAAKEVGGAVFTAVATTIISFLPVFTMEGAEGKLFKPLAFTKSFALAASLVVALALIPPLCCTIYRKKGPKKNYGWIFYEGLLYGGVLLAFLYNWAVGLFVALIGVFNLAEQRFPEKTKRRLLLSKRFFIALGVIAFVSVEWMPLGIEKGRFQNFLFVLGAIGMVLAFFFIFRKYYEYILRWCLNHKAAFLAVPLVIIFSGLLIWVGFSNLFGWLPAFMLKSSPSAVLKENFPGLKKEFMPPLDEGAYLYMPVTMPHASIGEILDILQRQDRRINSIPEIKEVVGKLGRVESPLDPAPISMIETLISYRQEYLMGEEGNPLRFRYTSEENGYVRDVKGRLAPAGDGKPYRTRGRFLRDENMRLIPDPDGKPFRVWRKPLDPDLNPGREPWDGIRSPEDIWDEIVKAANILGATTAPKLQPISARMVMLQSGIRADMGVRVYGPDLQTVESVTRDIEKFLREVDVVDPLSVIADRIVGKPYLEIHIDRRAVAQHGIDLRQVQDVIETAIGGKRITTTVEGRERYPVRVRYMRELRDHIDSIGKVLVPSQSGAQIPLIQLSDIKYVPGPQVIKSENTFITGYVLFEKKDGYAGGYVVEKAREYLLDKIEGGELKLPEGVSFSFAGSYENQIRAEKKLRMILPLALLIIFIILYMQFRSISTSALVFTGIAAAWSGGFIMIWLYGQPWFLDFTVFGASLKELFQVHTINLSVAIWVGFLALFGIASDDGVVMATYLDGAFGSRNVKTVTDIRETTVEASMRRVRPCLMTTATTILALLPVLTSKGRGSDIMVPMAIPTFGGMAVGVVSMLMVPVLYCAIRERRLKKGGEG